jgi:hypothetical protein
MKVTYNKKLIPIMIVLAFVASTITTSTFEKHNEGHKLAEFAQKTHRNRLLVAKKSSNKAFAARMFARKIPYFPYQFNFLEMNKTLT